MIGKRIRLKFDFELGICASTLVPLDIICVDHQQHDLLIDTIQRFALRFLFLPFSAKTADVSRLCKIVQYMHGEHRGIP